MGREFEQGEVASRPGDERQADRRPVHLADRNGEFRQAGEGGDDADAQRSRADVFIDRLLRRNRRGRAGRGRNHQHRAAGQQRVHPRRVRAARHASLGSGFGGEAARRRDPARGDGVEQRLDRLDEAAQRQPRLAPAHGVLPGQHPVEPFRHRVGLAHRAQPGERGFEGSDDVGIGIGEGCGNHEKLGRERRCWRQKRLADAKHGLRIAGEPARRVEARGQRRRPGQAEQPLSRAQPVEPAIAGRNPHRAAGIRADADMGAAGRDHRHRAARRAARQPVRRRRVERRAVMGVAPLQAEGEFDRRCLAGDAGAGLEKLRDDPGMREGGAEMPPPVGVAEGGHFARDVEQVLDDHVESRKRAVRIAPDVERFDQAEIGSFGEGMARFHGERVTEFGAGLNRG